VSPYDHLLESAASLDDETYLKFAEEVAMEARHRNRMSSTRDYVVCAIYDDNCQKFTTTVNAEDVNDAIAGAKKEADSDITIAAVITGIDIRVEDLNV
jgi:hypothetical protein